MKAPPPTSPASKGLAQVTELPLAPAQHCFPAPGGQPFPNCFFPELYIGDKPVSLLCNRRLSMPVLRDRRSSKPLYFLVAFSQLSREANRRLLESS